MRRRFLIPFRDVLVHARRHDAHRQVHESCAFKGDRSTTLNDFRDNLPVPHLPRVPLFIDVVAEGRSKTNAEKKRATSPKENAKGRFRTDI